jgi:hypothetical protein
MPKRTIFAFALAFAFAFSLVAFADSPQKTDDTARFYGNWTGTFLYNNVPVTMLSVHDAKGVKNYILLPQGAAPVGSGDFSAAGGTWSSVNSPAPNNTGTYKFIDNNTAFCTNALGQGLLWQRYNLPLPPIIGDAGNGGAAPLANDLTHVKSSDALKASRATAAAWKPDALLFWAQVAFPNPDGTVNILAHPQAFNFLYYSPSANTAVSVVSTAPTGALVITAPANVRPMPTIPIKLQSIDLSQAFTNGKLFGFNGNASQATLSFQAGRNKPMRLVWEIEVGADYPLVISGATGALLSPFEIVDDKVADYNALAAAHARGGRNGRGAVTWRSETGINFWEPDSNHSADSRTNNPNGPDEEDTYDRDVRLQNAFDNGDTAAYDRTLNNENTDQDFQNYGGGGGGAVENVEVAPIETPPVETGGE